MKYTFEEIEVCNMCANSTMDHKIMGRRLNGSQGQNPKLRGGITTTVRKCTSCGLIYSNPQPKPIDIQDHYGIPPENYWKEDYFIVDENYFQGEIKRLKQLIEMKSDLKSLDIGAGLGKQMIALSKIGFDTYGIEPSKPFFDRAVSEMGIPKSKMKLNIVEEAEYPDEFFDFISLGAVLEHLYDPSSSIQKALTWLKPNGIIHIEVPSAHWLVNRLINLYYKLTFKDYVGNLSPMHPPFHLYEFALKSFQLNAVKYKYEIAHYEYYVCKTYLPEILDIFLKPLMRKTNTGMQLCVWLRKSSNSVT